LLQKRDAWRKTHPSYNEYLHEPRMITIIFKHVALSAWVLYTMTSTKVEWFPNRAEKETRVL
jgi:hypothetical protein